MTRAPPQGTLPAMAVATAGALRFSPQTSGTHFTFFGMELVPPRCVVCKEVPPITIDPDYPGVGDA